MCGEGISQRAFRRHDPLEPVETVNEKDRIDIH